ncbi:MAG: response regulator, partial [Desulfobacterales bacterium]|nr:response regulator [Desulfobacterales bacterium]
LSICGQLVEMMEGTITVDSAPDQGSRFTFTLPLIPWHPSEDRPDSTPADRFTAMADYRRQLEGSRVLVVEDTPTNQEIILAVLELAGIKPILVDSGIGAVDAVRSQGFDAVLMDLQMPGMDGFEATREIRKFKDREQLPIIAMTAHTLKEDEGKCMAAGMNAYISKPVDHDRLFETLMRMVPPGHPEKTDCDKQPPQTAAAPPKAIDNSDAQDKAATLPDRIPGIHLKSALASLGVNETVFLHILDTFFKNHESLITEIEDAWTRGDRERVITQVHSLKGSASGIGADALHRLALDMENKCKGAPALPERNQAPLNELENALTIVLASIRTLLSEYQPPPSPTGQHIPEQAVQVLTEFNKALAFPELKELELLTSRLSKVCTHPLALTIREHIADHDHDLAGEAVRELIVKLKGSIQ